MERLIFMLSIKNCFKRCLALISAPHLLKHVFVKVYYTQINLSVFSYEVFGRHLLHEERLLLRWVTSICEQVFITETMKDFVQKVCLFISVVNLFRTG